MILRPAVVTKIRLARAGGVMSTATGRPMPLRPGDELYVTLARKLATNYNTANIDLVSSQLLRPSAGAVRPNLMTSVIRDTATTAPMQRRASSGSYLRGGVVV